MSGLRASEQMNSVGALRVAGCTFRVGVRLCCTPANKPPRSSCSFMWGQSLSRADLASHGPSPFQHCRALSADQTALGRAFVPAPLLSGSESRFGPCRSIPSPPSLVSQSLCLSVTLVSPHFCHFHLSLSSLSLSFFCHLFSPSLIMHL